MKHVLILMADYGYGHRSAANAVAEALKETHGPDCEVEIVNPLDNEHAPALLRREQENYDNIIREMPDLYELGYKVTGSSLASNLIDKGIRVNAVAPGPVWTPLNPADSPADKVQQFGQQTDMKRPAQPEELSPAYVFLASPVCSGYITGIVLPVTGSIGAG